MGGEERGKWEEGRGGEKGTATVNRKEREGKLDRGGRRGEVNDGRVWYERRGGEKGRETK
jgi:hypothetical protein